MNERDQAIARSTLLDVNEVAEMLNCSVRHVYRLADSGRMPRPVKLGSLVRWELAAIEAWITQRCPPAGESPSRGR